MFYLGGHDRHDNISASNRRESLEKGRMQCSIRFCDILRCKKHIFCPSWDHESALVSWQTDGWTDRWRSAPQGWGLNIPSLRLLTPVTVGADSSQADVWNVFGAPNRHGRVDLLPHGSRLQRFPPCRTKCVCRPGRQRRIHQPGQRFQVFHQITSGLLQVNSFMHQHNMLHTRSSVSQSLAALTHFAFFVNVSKTPQV